LLETADFLCDKGFVDQEPRAMSESAAMQSKPKADTADRQTLAHVEKWLAVIREMSGARQK
jgi:hypothetical protein